MPILTKEVEVKPVGKIIQYYKEMGYNAKHKRPLMVKVEDLPKNSCKKVEVLCDMCKKNTMTVVYESYNIVVENTGSYVCKECSSEKRRRTNQEKYGVPYPIQNELFKKKREQTYLERYGVTNILQSEEFKEKQRHTMRQRYGVDSPMKLQAFKEKQSKTMYENGTQKASKQQLYLHRLYGGELNYPIKYYDADICFPDENIVVEYDGSGHNLSVRFGNYTQEEFDQREIVRNNVLKKEGYKQMRIVSKRDKLPSDSILLQMLSEAKQYFSATNHSWITYDIDNSLMINAENKNTNGIFYDYGKLRTIKEVS